MASAANSSECNYLRSHTLRIPRIFSSERAELAHINERISSLDRHISELNALRKILHYHSCKLHNLFSPIRILPIEILSRIFEQVISTFPADPQRLHYQYHQCLSQAFRLASVSVHFRHAAFGTPELWRRIPLLIDSLRSIRRASSLLQHCTALATGVRLTVFDKLSEGKTPSAIDAILTPVTMQRIKAFDLFCSVHAPEAWIRKLSELSCTMLDTFSIQHPPKGSLDLGALKTVTRLDIYDSHLSLDQSFAVIAPPSLRYLTIVDVLQPTLVSLLYQCPNLVECTASVHPCNLRDAARFNERLNLSHLKHLTLRKIRAITMPSSHWQNVQLPSLETLQIEYHERDEFSGIILLCRNVSSTLTALKILVYLYSKTLKQEDLSQLWRISFPKLRELELGSSDWEPISSIIQALALRADKRWNTKPHYLPSLVALTLHCKRRVEARCLLELLAKWKIGKASDFYVEVRSSYQEFQDLAPDFREELRSIVGSRRIEFTWYGYKVLQLSRAQTTDG